MHAELAQAQRQQHRQQGGIAGDLAAQLQRHAMPPRAVDDDAQPMFVQYSEKNEKKNKRRTKKIAKKALMTIVSQDPNQLWNSNQSPFRIRVLLQELQLLFELLELFYQYQRQFLD